MDSSNLPQPARAFAPDTFKDQVALITGGGTGLGLEISRSLAALGAKVTIASRSTEHHGEFLNEARERGWSADAVTCDVREPDQVQRMTDSVLDQHGKIDILVNNAAGNFVCPSERLSARAWRAVLGIVLDGTFYCSRDVGKHMLKSGGGTMLNVVATYAWTGMPGVAHSASAKAGVLALTKTLAAEWADRGVRVNCVAPGPFHTDGASANLWPDPKVEERIKSRIPLGRFATREEVATHCLYLLAPVSAYITGECLVIDGGMTLAAGRMFEVGDRVARKPRAKEAGQ